MNVLITVLSLLVLALQAQAATDDGAPHEVVHVSVTCPSGGYSLTLKEAHAVDDELWLLIAIQPPKPGMMVTQALTRTHLRGWVSGQYRNQRIFILGRSWDWKTEGENYTVVPGTGAYRTLLADQTDPSEVRWHQGAFTPRLETDPEAPPTDDETTE